MCGTAYTAERRAADAAEYAKRKEIAAKFLRTRKDTFSYPGGYPRPQFFSAAARSERQDEKWDDEKEMEEALRAAGPCSAAELAKWASNFSTDEKRAEAVEMLCTQVFDLIDDYAIEVLASAVKEDQKKREALRASLKKDLPLLMQFFDTIEQYSKEQKAGWIKTERQKQ
jgi:hypothetical protein